LVEKMLEIAAPTSDAAEDTVAAIWLGMDGTVLGDATRNAVLASGTKLEPPVT
jgi:hypothetical protein